MGDLVYTAFSGSHQDAIKKGFAAQQPDAVWEVPYLPIDPADLGRTYDSVIRVNSQSGKGGIAFLLEREKGISLPRRMQVEFSAIVQRYTDSAETEITASQLWELFQATYFEAESPLAYQGHRLSESAEGQVIELDLVIHGQAHTLRGTGNGPIAATVDALGLPVRVDSYEERSLGSGADATAFAVVELACEGQAGARFGAGQHANIVTASILALISAVQRLGIVPTQRPAAASVLSA